MSEPWAILVAAAIDAAFGEPGSRVHPVAWLGSLIAALDDRRPRNDPHRELAWGAGVVAITVGAAGGAGALAQLGLRRLPLVLRVPLAGLALKPAFALRGLTDAAAGVRAALDHDLTEARSRLPALVARDPGLDEPHVVSAAVESLAENLTDSVVAPLLAYAILGLPGAYAYRAVNTLDAMIGYHGDHEYAGKIAARLDDVANYLPARLTGLLLCVAGGSNRRAAARQIVQSRRAAASPNAMWTIASMAGLLGVRLEKPGAYAVGDPLRPNEPCVIDEGIRITRRAGAAGIGLTVLVSAARTRQRRRTLRMSSRLPAGMLSLTATISRRRES